ncbi:MAG: phage holin family protein [Puniceicoccales bacterium]|nr:phage holin family protein [Puniceicoccales bacterium]
MSDPGTDESSSSQRQGSPQEEIEKLAVRALTNRFELASLEAEDACWEAGATAIYIGLGICLAGMAGMVLNMFLLAAIWDSPHRLLWIGALFLLEAGLSLLFFLLAQYRLRRWRPFGELLTQLKADFICWRNQSR